MSTYRVEIVEVKTGKVESIIGKNLSDRQAERRELAVLSRINDNYFVRVAEEGI